MQFFGLVYLAFLLFNVLTTWWIVYSTLFGVVMANLLNALFMAITFTLFHWIHARFNDNRTYAALPLLWLTWEWLHLDWDLSWPWLTMGNGFAAWTKMVQWYEYTGVAGGSLWIITVNIMLFLIFKDWQNHKTLKKRRIIITSALVVLPIVVSYIIYSSYIETTNPVNVVILQPNIDPYNEKFGSMSADEQLKKMLKLAQDKVDSTTDYLIGPETAIPNSVWEDQLQDNRQIKLLRSYLSDFPRLTLVIGISTTRFYAHGVKRSETARKFADSEDYYDSYNTAIQIDSTKNIPVYHKSKLVPGVEKMPFPGIFKSIEKFAIDLGGASGSLGIQKEPSVFKNNVDTEFAVAPIICYESIYGEFVSRYVNKGASLLFIVTNDGWWDNTPGYRQHLQYGRLRAIEMRRSIARSANTGISAVINQRGDIEEHTEWWQPAAIKATINANHNKTFYAKYGDYLSVISAVLSLLILLSTAIFKSKLFRKNK